MASLVGLWHRPVFRWAVFGYIVLSIGVVTALWRQQHIIDHLFANDARLTAADTRLKATGARLTIQARRSCSAIQGAVRFWTFVRAANIQSLNDKGLGKAERRLVEQYIGALTLVISRGKEIPCAVPLSTK